jgi:7-cyano-7-deazaguanine synthase in queuosine biosynthesis
MYLSNSDGVLVNCGTIRDVSTGLFRAVGDVVIGASLSDFEMACIESFIDSSELALKRGNCSRVVELHVPLAMHSSCVWTLFELSDEKSNLLLLPGELLKVSEDISL